jgi:hypothetical protein
MHWSSGQGASYSGECLLIVNPDPPTPEQAATLRDLAERLDAHRKRQQTAHSELTLIWPCWKISAWQCAFSAHQQPFKMVDTRYCF